MDNPSTGPEFLRRPPGATAQPGPQPAPRSAPAADHKPTSEHLIGVVDSLNEMTNFRSLVEGYEQFIRGIDSRNAKLDDEIAQLHKAIADREAVKRQNLAVRASKVTKLTAVRTLIRNHEDAQTAKDRAAEDAQTAERS